MEYSLRRRKLPAEVLMLKEVAKQVLSARCYGEMLKYRIELKHCKDYQDGFGNASGCFNMWEKRITVRTNGESMTHKNNMHVWVHELAHLVWHMNGNVNRKRTKVHAKAFKNILQRMSGKLETLDIEGIMEGCERKADEQENLMQAKQEQAKLLDDKKQGAEYKLEKTRKQIRRWETKEKRAVNRLKKLRRREKLYIRMTEQHH